MRIAAAQTRPVAGDRGANLAQHLALIENAAKEKATLVLFPELSLTGYEPSLLRGCITTPGESLLEPVRAAAMKHQIVVILGAPTASQNAQKIHISALIFLPNGQVSVYHKQYLHPGEERFAVPGPKLPFFIQVAGATCALAICADVTHTQHHQQAKEAGATLYLVGMVVSESGYDTDRSFLVAAAGLDMSVLMANMGGPSGGFACAGRSAAWVQGGALVAEAPRAGVHLLVVDVSV